MNVLNVKLLPKGTFVATFDLEIPLIHMTVRRCKLMKKEDGSMWISLPAESYQDEGKKKFFKLVVIAKEKQAEFERIVMDKLQPYLNGQQTKAESKSSDPTDFPF